MPSVETAERLTHASFSLEEMENMPICGIQAARGIIWHCPTSLCSNQMGKHFTPWAVEKFLKVMGLGDSLAKRLVDGGLVKSPTDLYRLTMEQLKTLPRFSEKAATDLLAKIELSKTAPLWRFIHALGIRAVGERTGKILAEHFKSLQALAEVLAVIPADPIIAWESGRDVITINGTSYYDATGGLKEFFNNPFNAAVLADLTGDELGINPTLDEPMATEDMHLKGLKFVLTGTLANYTRAEAAAHIRALGGCDLSTVSAETDYVVAGEAAGSKLTKAKKLGIAILCEREFTALLDVAMLASAQKSRICIHACKGDSYRPQFEERAATGAMLQGDDIPPHDRLLALPMDKLRLISQSLDLPKQRSKADLLKQLHECEEGLIEQKWPLTEINIDDLFFADLTLLD